MTNSPRGLSENVHLARLRRLFVVRDWLFLPMNDFRFSIFELSNALHLSTFRPSSQYTVF
jgi:hypothetical protein